jgi:peptidoglycan/xylan/chitin deacetylase (PgdA/CDA1 family)
MLERFRQGRLTRGDLLRGSLGAALGGIGVALFQNEAAAVRVWALRGVVDSAAGLEIRDRPSTSARLVDRLADGSDLVINRTSGEWFRITSLGRLGWVNSWSVRLTGTPSIPIYQGDESRPMVALTFDCGSDYGFTDQILATLAENDVPATFGVTGHWIENNPDGMRRIGQAGHAVINHTLTHRSFTGFSTPGADPLSPAQRIAELLATETLIHRHAGVHTRPNWRPPYGDIDDGVLNDVGALGFTRTVMWDIDSFGWNGLTAGEIHDWVMGQVENGSIVLMHVGALSQDGNALGPMIRDLAAQGYTFGTTDQVIG